MSWPAKFTADHQKEGITSQLTFPAFHPEILTQNYWNAGENIGRIKVVIAEGIIRNHGSAFEKTKAIVCFSFQHAPLRKSTIHLTRLETDGATGVLEESGIAYPNSGMLYQLQNQICSLASPPKCSEPDPDAHGHSPRHRNSTVDSSQPKVMMVPSYAYQDHSASGLVASRNPPFAQPYWPQVPPVYGACYDNGGYHAYRRRPAPSSSGDQSMPDYSHSLTPSSSRNISHNHDPQDQMAEVFANVGGILDSCYHSPNRPVSNGTVAPANTRVSSATGTPISQNRKASTAAETRSSSYSHNQVRSVSITTRDPAKSAIREPSEMSMQSRSSDQISEQDGEPAGKIKKKPAKEVKGRKEGKGGEREVSHHMKKKQSQDLAERDNKENSKGMTETASGLADGKRKRSTASMRTTGKVPSGSFLNSSPSRKVSRISNAKDQDLDNLTTEGVMMRAPLADVGNTQ